MKKIITKVLLVLSINVFGQTWNLLIPPSSFDTTSYSFFETAYNRNSNIIYSVYKDATTTKIQGFNLNSNTVNLITTTSNPAINTCSFTYDYTNNRIIMTSAGRDNLYAVSANGGAWSQIGSGSADSQSYGASFYWNSTNQKTGFFGGYGLFYVKNWIWENSGTWINPYIDNTNCNSTNPAKRITQVALGNPNSSKLYLFSGYGSCNGQQTATSCSLGSPWATNIGIYCWLKDLWQLDLSNHTFTNILPVNSTSISKEGKIVYDYVNNTFYIIGGYIPSPTYNSNFGNITNFQTTVLRYRVGIDSGFLPFLINGTPPPTKTLNNIGSNSTYFDASNNQIVWARKDGIWAIKLCNTISTTTSFTNISCNGVSNGAASVFASGGTGGFNYSWAPSGGTGSTALGLSVGNYTVTVTDANSCTTTKTVTITQPATALLTTTSVTNVLCNGGAAGSAAITANGGTPGYTYLWSTAATTSVISGQTAGVKTVTVTDANSCKKTNTVTITEPSAITTAISSQTNVSCFGGLNGAVSLAVSGGAGIYSYSWAPAGGNASIANNLSNGSYTCTISDINNCVKSTLVTITAPAQITVSVSIVNQSCIGSSDGAAQLTLSGGVSPFSILWSNGLSTLQNNNLTAGNYSVAVTDANACTYSLSIVVNDGALTCFEVPSGFSPNGDGINDTWEIPGIDKYPNAVVTILNRWGQEIFNITNYATPWNGSYNGSILPTADYYYIIKLDSNSQPLTGTVTIKR